MHLPWISTNHKNMESQYSYDNIHLPKEEKVSDILDSDCFLIDHVTSQHLSLLTDPVKISAFTSVMVMKGEFRADISLSSFAMRGPSIVNIRPSQILTASNISDDFEAVAVVMSERLRDYLFLLSGEMPAFNIAASRSVIPVAEEYVGDFRNFYDRLAALLAMRDNPFHFQAVGLAIMQFFCQTAWRVYEPHIKDLPITGGMLSDRFLTLVRENFKKERFLDVYANELKITPKHRSRTIKTQTGVSAVEWIDRFVVLEAKVLLKSSRLNIQQISDNLNFPSQSFFGKYFKKQTGFSPKEFRNGKEMPK